MKVKALRAHSYDGDNYKRGEEYEVQLKHFKVLVAAKAVEAVGKDAASVPAKKRNVEVSVDSKPEKKKRGRPKGSYSRKDLRAEDDEPSELPSREE